MVSLYLFEFRKINIQFESERVELCDVMKSCNYISICISICVRVCMHVLQLTYLDHNLRPKLGDMHFLIGLYLAINNVQTLLKIFGW